MTRKQIHLDLKNPDELADFLLVQEATGIEKGSAVLRYLIRRAAEQLRFNLVLFEATANYQAEPWKQPSREADR